MKQQDKRKKRKIERIEIEEINEEIRYGEKEKKNGRREEVKNRWMIWMETRKVKTMPRKVSKRKKYAQKKKK